MHSQVYPSEVQPAEVYNVPAVYEIPEDYTRQKRENPARPMEQVEEIYVTTTNEQSYIGEIDEIKNDDDTPQATAPVVSPNRQAVILVAHTGTSNMQHLGRKPRSSRTTLLR